LASASALRRFYSAFHIDSYLCGFLSACSLSSSS